MRRRAKARRRDVFMRPARNGADPRRPNIYNVIHGKASVKSKGNAHGTAANSSDHESEARPFDLIRWFLFLGLAAIAVVSIVTSVLFSRFLTHHMLERDAVLTMEEVRAIARIENAFGLFKTGQWDREDRNIREFFSYISSMHDVMRANIYSADGIVVWSTDKALVGKKYDSNLELDEALAGKLTVEHGIVGDEQHPKPEHINLGQRGDSYVENYIPMVDPADNRLIGVVELYRIPRALFETLSQGVQLIWFSAFAAGGFLFLMLFSLIKRADRTMRAQQRRLVETETLAAVGQLSGAVAHSLRNPLSSIRSSAELALDGPVTESRETSRDIIVEVDRLEGMVRQLLFYSQSSSDEIAHIDIGPVLHDVVRSFARDADKRQTEMTLDIAADLPRVRADGMAIAQVFNSLVTNALDALPRGGHISIAARLAPRARTVDIEVRDTGKGIPRSQMRDLFKPFRTTKAKGLGMGLALAERIVRRFGGTLAIDSEEGLGTVVKVSLRTGSPS
jgi:signal transduction histidine kinase